VSKNFVQLFSRFEHVVRWWSLLTSESSIDRENTKKKLFEYSNLRRTPLTYSCVTDFR
jgi:hypothetical protein